MPGVHQPRVGRAWAWPCARPRQTCNPTRAAWIWPVSDRGPEPDRQAAPLRWRRAPGWRGGLGECVRVQAAGRYPWPQVVDQVAYGGQDRPAPLFSQQRRFGVRCPPLQYLPVQADRPSVGRPLGRPWQSPSCTGRLPGCICSATERPKPGLGHFEGHPSRLSSSNATQRDCKTPDPLIRLTVRPLCPGTRLKPGVTT